jgi:hypothetical protein
VPILLYHSAAVCKSHNAFKPKCMYHMCLVCAWYVLGMCLVCAWYVLGMCLVCAWYYTIGITIGMCMYLFESCYQPCRSRALPTPHHQAAHSSSQSLPVQPAVRSPSFWLSARPGREEGLPLQAEMIVGCAARNMEGR